ncbi:hypothetical protein [Dyadobacter fermentans]|nr:hypothetical protein [Dyadobacter fermentans]MBZ1358068.1 hypothetical protein [Dyadobacter fermentans]
MERYHLTPEQRKIVEEKVRSLEKLSKNIDFNNLPKIEDHPEVAKSRKKG